MARFTNQLFIYFCLFMYECLPRIASTVPNGSVINEGPASEVLIVFKAPIWATEFSLLN